MNIKLANQLKRQEGQTMTLSYSYYVAEAMGYIQAHKKAERILAQALRPHKHTGKDKDSDSIARDCRLCDALERWKREA